MAKPRCVDCGFVAKSPAGLETHRRAKHRPAAARSNVAAVEVTLGELDRMGRLEDIDEARVQAVRSIAEALDANPFNSQMWREYREALRELTADGDDDGIPDGVPGWLSSSVRDAPPG